MRIYGKRKGRLREAVEQRWCAEELWYVQVDAAAKVVQKSKVDGGGRGRRVERREDDDEVKRHEGEMERPPGPIYKGDKRQAQKSRSQIF